MGMVKIRLLTEYFAQLIQSTIRTRNSKFAQIGGKGAPGQVREI